MMTTAPKQPLTPIENLFLGARTNAVPLIMAALRDGVAVDARQTGALATNGWTALHVAVRFASLDAVKALLEAGASIYVPLPGKRMVLDVARSNALTHGNPAGDARRQDVIALLEGASQIPLWGADVIAQYARFLDEQSRHAAHVLARAFEGSWPYEDIDALYRARQAAYCLDNFSVGGFETPAEAIAGYSSAERRRLGYFSEVILLEDWKQALVDDERRALHKAFDEALAAAAPAQPRARKRL